MFSLRNADDVVRNRYELQGSLKRFNSELSNEKITSLIDSIAGDAQFKILSADMLAIVLLYLNQINYIISNMETPQQRYIKAFQIFKPDNKVWLDSYLKLILPTAPTEKYFQLKADFLRYLRLVVHHRERPSI